VLQFGAFLEDPRSQEPLAVCLGKSDGQLVDLETKNKVKIYTVQVPMSMYRISMNQQEAERVCRIFTIIFLKVITVSIVCLP
jgi:hypothetical protein